MKTYTGINDKRLQIQKRNLIWVIALFVFFSTYFYVPPEYSDLGRYYDSLETLSKFNNIMYAVLLMQEQDFDFIYTLIMLVALNFGIKLQFVTALVCSIYWVIISKVFLKDLNKISHLVILGFIGVVCFPNMMYVLSTARNVMAFLFLFMGFRLWSKNKKVWSIVFFILSVFTHLSCTIYIFLYFIVSLFYKIWLSKHPSWTNTLCLLFPVFMYLAGITLVNSIFMSPVMQDIFGESTGYGSYVSKEVEGVTYDFIGIGELVYLVSHILLVYVLINLDRRNSLQRVMTVFFFSMITMSYGCTYNLLVRFLLCTAFFYSSYISDLISNISKNKVLLESFLRLSSVLLFLVFVWNFHGLIMKYWQF